MCCEQSVYVILPDKCPNAVEHGSKLIEMATFAGPDSEHPCISENKVFQDPKRDCIRNGVWTGRDPKCFSKTQIFRSIMA